MCMHVSYESKQEQPPILNLTRSLLTHSSAPTPAKAANELGETFSGKCSFLCSGLYMAFIVLSTVSFLIIALLSEIQGPSA